MNLVKAFFRFFLISILLLNCFFVSGCWNYKEVNQFATVAGLAVDKAGSNYIATVEIYNTKGGQGQLILKPVIYSNKGVTIFDAIRSTIIKTGRKLYWSHAKAVIISKTIAKKSVLPVIDWLNRDAEIRTDMWVFVSKEKTAAEILRKGKVQLNDVVSYQLNQTMLNEKFVSQAPAIDLWTFIAALSSKGVSGIMPVIDITSSNKKTPVLVGGTAIFRRDKLIGFINKRESMYLLFVQNKIRGGILPFIMPDKERTRISLEIHKSKTTILPVYKKGILTMKINIKPTVDIAEIAGTKDYTNNEGMKKLQTYTQKTLEKKIEHFIKKLQSKYDSDVFGFSSIVLVQKTRLRRSIGKRWNKFYKSIKPKVKVTFDITGTATTKNPIKVSD